MPPTYNNKFSNEINEGITRNNGIDNISNSSNKIYRRQGPDVVKNTNNKKPTPVSSIPTITIPSGSATFTLISDPTTTTNIIPIPTNVDDIPDDDSNPNPDDGGTPDGIPSGDSPKGIPGGGTPPDGTPPDGIPPDGIPKGGIPSGGVPTVTNATPTPTSTYTDISNISSSLPTDTPVPTSSFPQIPPASSSNKLYTLILPILAVLLLIVILAFLGFIYRKRKRKRNVDNNLKNISAENILKKENDSKSNSLTSSINSISSSFKIKKGKVAPEDISTGGIPPTSIVTDDGDEFKRPTIKRTPTTVSAFTEMVDLDDLNQSTIGSRVNFTFVNDDAEEGSSSNAIPLHQERIDTVIPFSSASGSGIGSGSGSGSGSGTRNNNINNDDNDKQ